MIAGIGIDMVSINRISEKVSKPDFKQAVFTESEIQYCESTSNKMQHYAARFAVKEAFLKARGTGIAYDIDILKQIEVYHTPESKPAVRLLGTFETERWTNIHVSISHEGDNAVAIVILEK